MTKWLTGRLSGSLGIQPVRQMALRRPAFLWGHPSESSSNPCLRCNAFANTFFSSLYLPSGNDANFELAERIQINQSQGEARAAAAAAAAAMLLRAESLSGSWPAWHDAKID